eukprot:EC723033.1.p1 GENE.EC723033.1~~EC723033.1.p1  ORF type:complete len:159 (+),score=31.93 EC723033.1:59-535(+)
MAAKNYQQIGDLAFRKLDRVNGDLFCLTYGALVTQLVKDYENIEEVNKQLEKMGWNIGVRIIDEYFAKSGAGRCSDFKDAAEAMAKVGFKMFLGVNARTVNWNPTSTEFSLIIEDNPLADYVELPEAFARTMWYSNLLVGVIRGAFEMVQYRVEARFV